MLRSSSRLAVVLLLVGAVAPARAIQQATAAYNVRSFGATGDGKSVDSDAINKAIDAAAAAGGGVVDLPAGRYLSFSIRLKSHVTLRFHPGAVLVAGDAASGLGKYDLPEPNPSDQYQDFGHSHWRNSLISGIDVEEVAIVGPGLIDGRGLTRSGPGAPWSRSKAGDRPLSMGRAAGAAGDPEAVAQRRMEGQGNKAISLKRARNVTLRDFCILNGGHFALLATGVDTLTIDNLERISSFSVSSPNRDAIVLESSDALGQVRADVFDLNVRNVTGVADGRHGHIAAGTLPHQPQ